jgi:cell wall-associated NlpC family hydrolase
MAKSRINGLALGSVAAGSVFLFAGIKGYSVTQTLQVIVSGRSPAGQAQVNPISGTPPLAASASGNLGSGTGAAIAADALKYAGRFPYAWGGAPASGSSDCSGFCNWVIGHDQGLAIPFYKVGGYNGSSHGPATMTWLAWAGCTTVSHSGADAVPGDLCIWQTHMGIAIGGGQMISAQNPQSGTQVSGIDGFVPELLFIRRLRAVGASSTIASAGPH